MRKPRRQEPRKTWIALRGEQSRSPVNTTRSAEGCLPSWVSLSLWCVANVHGHLTFTHSYSLQAPSEAEAQCAELARGGKVYAAGSEDMDTLTFGAPILYRHLTFSEARKTPISEINLQKALEGLEMSMSQVDISHHLLGWRLNMAQISSSTYVFSSDATTSNLSRA